MGVSKTATCRELQKILPRNVFLDGDWCWDIISLYDELDTVKIDVSTISPADAARRITEHMAGVQANIANRK
jgi:hypothetical protein